MLVSGFTYILTGSLIIAKVLPRVQIDHVDAVEDGLNFPALFATQWLSAALGHATIMKFYAPQLRKLFEHAMADGGLSRAHSECVVCLQKRADLAFLPCGHLTVCMACAGKLGFIEGEPPSSEDRCPICRALVAAWVRIYT